MLVKFGCTAEETLTPYSDWTQILRSPQYTTFVNPDGDPSHCGIAVKGEVPLEELVYFGIQGNTPLPFVKGQRVVATFYNRSGSPQSLKARVSFVDPDSPDPDDGTKPWYTLYGGHKKYKDGKLLPHEVEYEYYITDASMLHHVNSIPTEGKHTVVNINLVDNNPNFVLTKIELRDDADVMPPTIHSNPKIELVSTTEGTSPNVIKLTWEPSLDLGANAHGIQKYLIYRNGELYEEKPQAVIEKQGGRPYFIDLNVAPDTEYTYTITAVDDAPFGMYAHYTHPDSRKGNESLHTPELTIRTPPWSSDTLLNPHEDLEYRGVFRLPYIAGGGAGSWKSAFQGLTFYPQGNLQYNPEEELPGSLYGIGASSLSEISIPKPVIVTPETIEQVPEAKTLTPFTNIWPKVYYYTGEYHDVPRGGGGRTLGLTYHPAANGVEEGLYYSISNWYSTDESAPPGGVFSMNLDSVQAAWHVGGLPSAPDHVSPNLITGFAFKLSDIWAKNYTEERTLALGSTYISGGGTPSRGPVLYAVAPWEKGTLPEHGEAVSAVELLRYAGGYGYDKMLLNYSGGEWGHGGAWLSTALKGAVAIQISRTVGEHWYGDSGGQQNCHYDIPKPQFGFKGYKATRRSSRLLLYNPTDIAAVARGEKQAWEPQPYVEYDMSPFALKEGGMQSAGALAYDETQGYLYFMDNNGDPAYKYGQSLIHVWRIKRLFIH